MGNLEPVDIASPGVADFFDELPLWSAPFVLLLLERVPMRNGLSILDVGAGTGFLAVDLAQRCGPQSTVIAVDPWQAAVERLRAKVEYLGIQNLRVLEQDAVDLDLPESSIDVVVSNLGINNFDNVDTVMGTCFRALKPDGLVILTTNLVGHMREFYDVYCETLLQEGLSDCVAALDAHIGRRATVESVGAQLRRAGFDGITTTEKSFQMRFADGSALLRHYFIRLGFLEGWMKVVPPERVDETFLALERNLNKAAAVHGELALTIPMACVEARKPANPYQTA